MARQLFRAELLGVKEVENAFRQLGRTHTRTTLQRLLKKAGQPVKRVAEITAPRDVEPDSEFGHMADNIIVGRLSKSQQAKARRKGRGKRFAEIFIGPASKFRHAHLVEFGTGPRVSKKTGKTSGSMPPNAFMERSFRTTRKQSLKIMRVELWNEILKTTRRLRNRALKGKKVRLG